MSSVSFFDPGEQNDELIKTLKSVARRSLVLTIVGLLISITALFISYFAYDKIQSNHKIEVLLEKILDKEIENHNLMKSLDKKIDMRAIPQIERSRMSLEQIEIYLKPTESLE